MRNIFKDKNLQRAIEEEGYVVIPDYLKQEEIEELLSFYDNHPLSEKAGFLMSNWSKELETRTKIYNKIIEILTRRASAFIDSYKPVLACFAAKQPGENTEMELHQDWSLVDESVFSSISIWVPLVDINRENGNIQVLKKSHKYITAPRGQNIPVPFEAVKAHIKVNHLKDISISAGDAMIFEHRLVHGSPKNQSNQPRIAAVVALIPAEASLIHYFIDPGNPDKIEMLELEDQAYIEYDFFNYSQRPPSKRNIKLLDFKFTPITQKELIESK